MSQFCITRGKSVIVPSTVIRFAFDVMQTDEISAFETRERSATNWGVRCRIVWNFATEVLRHAGATQSSEISQEARPTFLTRVNACHTLSSTLTKQRSGGETDGRTVGQ